MVVGDCLCFSYFCKFKCIGSGLDFGLHTWATKPLEQSKSNGLLV